MAKAKRRYVSHYEGPRTQDLTTPKEFFDKLNGKYQFTLDGAATEENALLENYTSEAYPGAWAGQRVFCNPPWNDISSFVELATWAKLAVLLVPARVNAKWFHRALELGAKPDYFVGKLKFGSSKCNSPVDCLLLVFERGEVKSGKS